MVTRRPAERRAAHPEQPDGAVRRPCRSRQDTDASVRRSGAARPRLSSFAPAPVAAGTPPPAPRLVSSAPRPRIQVDTALRAGNGRAARRPDVRSVGTAPAPPSSRTCRACPRHARSDHGGRTRRPGRHRAASVAGSNPAPWPPRRPSGPAAAGGSGIDGLPSDLSSAQLLRPAKRPPQTGWRRRCTCCTGKLINPGESPADIRRARADRPGQPAAPRLLQDRDAEPQGRRRQDHDDGHARRRRSRPCAATG